MATSRTRRKTQRIGRPLSPEHKAKLMAGKARALAKRRQPTLMPASTLESRFEEVIGVLASALARIEVKLDALTKMVAALRRQQQPEVTLHVQRPPLPGDGTIAELVAELQAGPEGDGSTVGLADDLVPQAPAEQTGPMVLSSLESGWRWRSQVPPQPITPTAPPSPPEPAEPPPGYERWSEAPNWIGMAPRMAELPPMHGVWQDRLHLFQRHRLWLPEWGRRPDQNGTDVPPQLLEAHHIVPGGSD